MEPIRVSCPSCHLALRVPPAHEGKKGRCKQCGTVFSLVAAEATPVDHPARPLHPFVATHARADFPTAQASAGQMHVAPSQAPAEHAHAHAHAGPHLAKPSGPISEADIMDWLGGGSANSQGIASVVEKSPQPRQAMLSQAKPSPSRLSVRLGHVDNMGAFFLFDPSLLYDEKFRLTFPQKCVLCGSANSLQVHRVVWSAMLPHRGDLVRNNNKEDAKVTAVVYDLKQLAGKTGGKFLEALGTIEALPAPYCLPFPYCICPVCSPSGAIVTDVRSIHNGAAQECELGICSLGRAEEFALAVGGPESQDVLLIRQAIRQRGADPWQVVPLAVQSRIRKWYAPEKAEKFLAYIPDSDYARAEDGSAGLVVTDRRLVCFKQGQTVEIPLNSQLTVARMKEGQKINMHILSSAGKHAAMMATTATSEKLRHCLVQQGVKAKWS